MHKLLTSIKIMVYNSINMSISPEDLFIVQIAAALGTILGAWLLLARVVLPFIKLIRKLFVQVDDFMEDWQGTETRDGRAGTPGVMQRLNKIDGELSHNGGSSIKDSVHRIEVKIEEIDTRLESGEVNFKEIEKHLQEFDKIEEHLDQIEKDINPN